MYDVMHLGCIPVVLSDDLVWAFSKTAGGVIDPTAFSIQIPQQVRQTKHVYVEFLVITITSIFYRLYFRAQQSF